jgi:hypothetical protein
MSAVVLQKLQKGYSRKLDVAIAYYKLLSTLNNLNLQAKEIELLAFTAIRGTITPVSARLEFINLFGSSKASLENIKCRLVKKKLLYKHGEMYRVVPEIAPDFSRNIVMQINLTSKQ